MTLKSHTILTTVAAAALYPFMGNGVVFFWIGGVLIDIDHYLDFIYHNGFKDLRPGRMFLYHKILGGFIHRRDFLNIEVFHTIEFIAPLFVIGYAFGLSFLVALCWGFVFHIALDMISLFRMKASFKRAFSAVEYFIRKNRLKGKGVDTNQPIEDALRIMEDMEWQMKRF